MPDLPQCDAFGVIYDQHGNGAPDVLVTLKRVEDASGHPILLSPLTTLTDSDGQYFFTLPQAARAFITARATTLYDCNGGIVHLVPSAPTGPLSPILVPPAEAAGFVVQPPLYYSANVLSMTQSSRNSDGWLAEADFRRFDNSSADLADYLPLAGGTMTGFLTLSGNPLSTFHAATKNYVDMVRQYVDDSIAAIPLPPPLDTAADYTWTGTHTFTSSQGLRAYLIKSIDSGGVAPGVLNVQGTQILQLYSPNEIKISGQTTEISANITAARTQFLHPTEIEFGLSTLPPGNAAALLHYDAFDASYQQNDMLPIVWQRASLLQRTEDDS